MSRIRYMNFSRALRSGFFVVLLSIQMGVAAGQSGTASQYGLEKYTAITTDHGLPSNFVTAVLVDKKGFLWIGTNAGLARYDGKIMRVFDMDPQNQKNLPGSEITDLEMDDDGTIWVGTAAHGLCRFEEETGTFKRYGIFRKEVQKGEPSERIMSITNGANGLWVSVERYGAGRYVKERDEFEVFAVPGHEDTYTNRQRAIITSVLADPNDNDVVWMPSYDGLWELKISTQEWIMHDDSPSDKPEKANDIRSFRGASFNLDGKLYISVFRGGVLRFDPATQKWDRFSERNFNPQLLRENNYQNVMPRDSATLWLVSNTRGIGILDLQSGIIRTIGACNGESGSGDLCSVYANDFWVDEAGNAILATNKGLRIYTGKTHIFKQIEVPISTPHLVGRYNVTTIFPISNDKILSGGYAGEGVYLTDLQTGKTKLILPPKGHRVGDVREMLWVTHITPYRKSELIVVSAFEIFIFNTETETLRVASSNLEDFEHKRYYGRCFKHSDGLFYLSTRYDGVFVLDDELQVLKNLVHDPEDPNSLNSSNYIFDFESDPDGNLWIGSEKGFSIYNSESEIFQNSDRNVRKDSTATFKLALRVSINPADSTAWILDRRHGVGLLPYPYDKHLSNIRVLDASNGLLANKAHGIHHFPNGETYVITARGLTHISPDGNKISFPRELGFPTTRTFSPMAFDSLFWIGAGDKLTYFDPNEIEGKNGDVEMYISSIRVFQNELDSGRAYQDLKELKLTYRQNFMSIQVGSVNLFNPGVFNLSYRLKGFENQWVEAGSDQDAIFTNVPGGEYIFEARITDPNGRLSGKMITLPVRIIPPFWERWWFITACILFIISIAAIIYSVHARSIRREERMKSEFEKKLASTELAALRAQINPHFLFNSINGIRHEIMKGRLYEAETHLIKFSKLVRIILENVSYHIIPLREELDSLQLYIDLESLRFDNQFIFKIEKNADIDPDQTYIPPMLIQPFVENAIWHGLRQKKDRGTVSIELEKSTDRLFITITDNGIGREKALKIQSKSALKKRSLGMEITGNRLEIIEKLYNITCSAEIFDLKSEEGVPTGTKVLITLPLFYKHENRDIG